ncbi:MAG: lysylphosphatidylglycerol synthase transmembrane domain-containing protein [Solirubrobacterales bacterium]
MTAAGFGVSLISLAAVVWWAAGQEPPELPDTPGELMALAAGLVAYAIAASLRAERWLALLRRDGAHPLRADGYGLTLVGFMGNNVLPARGGDALRVVYMAPEARTARSVIGTLVAERLLDALTLLSLFAVVAYGLLRGIDTPGLASAGIAVGLGLLLTGGAVLVLRLARHTERGATVLEFLLPMAQATRDLRGGHGVRMLALTLAIWLAEALTYLFAAHAVGIDLNFVEALYILGVAGVFVLIPSGPGYIGTLDAAVIFATQAIGMSANESVSYLITLRCVLLVPITLAGLALLLFRYRRRPLRPASMGEGAA